MRLSIRSKLYLGFSIIIVLFLITAAVSTYLSQRNVNLTRSILESEQRMESVQRLNLFARTANDNLARYLIAPIYVEDEFKTSFDSGVQYVSEELIRLSAMIQEAEDGSQINSFKQKWASYMKESNQLIQMKKDGRVEEAREISSRDSFDPIAFSLHSFYVREKADTETYRTTIEHNGEIIRFINLTLTALAVLLSIAVAIVLSSHLTRRIRHLKNSAQAVAGGNLRVADLSFKGGDELAELAESFNMMKESLRSVIDSNHFLYHLSLLDGLTGIPNRRCYDETLVREWELLSTGDRSLAIILVDIDYFKFYNDQYGHQAGDACLKRVAGILLEQIRGQGFVARYGGEEFVVLLPDRTLDDAAGIAESLRKAVAGERIPHEGSKIEAFITLSLGVAAMPAALTASPEILLGQADEALYQAKSGGRNRTCVHGQGF
ncbi:diguanylate cyclase [Paenibacillus sp. HN-1]|uniref:diguanylate cyclase n=1 Tax=Paenibacillus TaxID=44249 RepID=UPI001CA80502|nr:MULTISPECIES: diguanylate cyclase [Paenibacillus]MBY9079128.1 diguanylate cyclase [Paenibacillus sp. CGMCC 1.18879]MBY9086906.1 diguanylate cyclase [Paenibacillus sinensis]